MIDSKLNVRFNFAKLSKLIYKLLWNISFGNSYNYEGDASEFQAIRNGMFSTILNDTNISDIVLYLNYII